MIWLTDARYLNNYQIWIQFNNGQEMVVDLESHLDGPIFEPLKHIDYFKHVKFNPSSDTIEWPNGADFSPEFLYQIAQDVPKTA